MKKLTAEQVFKMLELHGQGLSHSQIAIETGVCAKTVARYLGPQKAGNRARYGSLVAHSDGEHYARAQATKQETAREASNGVTAEQSGIVAVEEARIRHIPSVSKTPLLKAKSTVYAGTLFCYTVNENGSVVMNPIKDSEGRYGIRFSRKQFEQAIEEMLELLALLPEAVV